MFSAKHFFRQKKLGPRSNISEATSWGSVGCGSSLLSICLYGCDERPKISDLTVPYHRVELTSYFHPLSSAAVVLAQGQDLVPRRRMDVLRTSTLRPRCVDVTSMFVDVIASTKVDVESTNFDIRRSTSTYIHTVRRHTSTYVDVRWPISKFVDVWSWELRASSQKSAKRPKRQELGARSWESRSRS